jgi:hypothetical protein
MTAKEQASKIGGIFMWYAPNNKEAKQAAKECCNQIIEAIKTTIGHCTLSSLDHHECMSDIKYWREVIKEIDNL